MQMKILHVMITMLFKDGVFDTINTDWDCISVLNSYEGMSVLLPIYLEINKLIKENKNLTF